MLLCIANDGCKQLFTDHNSEFQGDNLRNSLLVRYFDTSFVAKPNPLEGNTVKQSNKMILHGPGG